MNGSHVRFPRCRSILVLDRRQGELPTLLGHCRTVNYWRRLGVQMAMQAEMKRAEALTGHQALLAALRGNYQP